MGPPTCRFCGLEFGSEYELRRHYHDEHEIEGGGETGPDGAESGAPPRRGSLERTVPDGEARDPDGRPRDPDGQRDRDDDPRDTLDDAAGPRPTDSDDMSVDVIARFPVPGAPPGGPVVDGAGDDSDSEVERLQA